MANVEYVIGEVAESATSHHRTFTVTKFEGGDQPTGSYKVLYNPISGYGRCDCPAAVYRNTGSADKHVKMVAQWLQSREGLKK